MSYIVIRYTDADGIDREITKTVQLTSNARANQKLILAVADWFFRSIGHPFNYTFTLIDKRLRPEGDGTPKGYGRTATSIVRAR